MGKKSMSSILREILVSVGVLFLIMFMCRLWPLLLLILIAIFVAMIVLLFKQANRIDEAEPMPIWQMILNLNMTNQYK